MIFVGKYAHYEKVEANDLLHLYGRHGEIARDIHQDTLREFTGNKGLTVDLVRESTLQADEAMLDKMSQYDVISVSTEIGMGAIIHGRGLADKNNVDLYRDRFSEEDMPVYVVAAGNSGGSGQVVQPRLADFSRTSLVVGEANVNKGEPFVEKISSTINPTLVSDNPFNRGEKYQYYDTSPSLEGHEDLIQDWLVGKEISRRFEAFKSGEGKGLDKYAIGDKYREIWGDIADTKYRESPEVQNQIKAFMAKPDDLHKLVMADLRIDKDIDAKGFTSDINGTSFSAPEQAGYVSGAMYEQGVREEKNLPILTKEEISTLAKMSTIDVSLREGTDDRMKVFNNKAGFDFSYASMHGVFRPEMFRNLLDEAYKKIETNPDINRDAVTATMSANVDNHDGRSPINIKFDKSVEQNIVVDRIRFDMNYSVNGSIPNYVEINPANEDVNYARLQQSSSGFDYTAWSRMEANFGETINNDDTWRLRIINGHDTTLKDVNMIVNGYNEDGLMDQMMDYSKTIAPQYTPKSAEPAQPNPEEIIINSDTKTTVAPPRV